MDMVREEMGKTFVQQQKNQVYQQTMKEMNAPLIPVSNELGILPFIGEIDTYKSQLVMESTTIERAQELELSTIILDLSGVSHIDTFVAQDIYNFSASLKLLGIEVVIVGFTPDIAQTSVHLNISFKQFTIYTNLAVALEQMKK